mmetsp:Transcript_83957/g.241375  ORF Transcript_83957/g.241375 Transcript_83957/m.241375 type:complete len:210 (+) Transcript_83957:176-805(+)
MRCKSAVRCQVVPQKHPEHPRRDADRQHSINPEKVGRGSHHIVALACPHLCEAILVVSDKASQARDCLLHGLELSARGRVERRQGELLAKEGIWLQGGAKLAVQASHRKLQPPVQLQLAPEQHQNAPEGQNQDRGNHVNPDRHQHGISNFHALRARVGSLRHVLIRELQGRQCKRQEQDVDQQQSVDPTHMGVVVVSHVLLHGIQQVYS